MGNTEKAAKLLKEMLKIESLESVPSDVSLRFHKTLSNLASEESYAKPKFSWATQTNRFALAASFVLVFALGAVFTLNSGNNSNTSTNSDQGSLIVNEESSGIKDDQLLYSGGADSIPESSSARIEETNIAHDYLEISKGLSEKLGVGNTWNSIEGLSASSLKCLKLLALSTNTNSIDSGQFKGLQIKAIWSPLTKTSWNVYIIDSKCNVIEKKYVKK